MGRGSLYKAGDILRNLKIRISDPRKKSAPEKLSQILLWLETYENDHFRTSEREREGGVARAPFISQKCPIVFQNYPLIF